MFTRSAVDSLAAVCLKGDAIWLRLREPALLAVSAWHMPHSFLRFRTPRQKDRQSR